MNKILFLFEVVFMVSSMSQISNAWWNASWNATYPIEINVSSNTTKYPMSIIFPQNSCNANYTDFRVTQSNGTDNVTIPHWIEGNTSTNATIWFTPNITTLNGTQVYAWCGNPAATNTSNVSAVFDSNLTALYLMNENTGTTVTDSSGNGNTLTGTKANWASGRQGSAWYFNGTGTSTTSATISPNTNFTIAFWKYDNSSTNARRRWVCTTIGGFGAGTVCLREGLSGAIETTSGSASLGGNWKNKWSYWVIVSNGTNQTIYMNATAVLTTAATSNPEANFYVSARWTGGGEYGYGIFENVIVSKNVWSLSDIQNSYALTEPTYSIGAEQTNGEPPTDSCTCPSINTNWEINLADDCVISTTCNIGTGNITFTGTGSVTFNASITAKGIGALPIGQRGYLGNNARVRVG